MSARILQFGTSRFLQAHAALFAHEAREAGQVVGPITVVQVSNSTERAARIEAFGRAGGFPVIVRGMVEGAPVDRRITVRSVESALSARRDWAALCSLFAGDSGFVISNTGDRGYELDPRDRGIAFSAEAAPLSFPAKLAALLHHRWQTSSGPITILPCELVSRNGDALREAVIAAARDACAPEGFIQFVANEIVFANTLVDRIVSEPIEPVGAIAEPYALWAIARQPGLALPFEHPSVVLTDDLEPFERLKLHILNLGHTVLAERWLREERSADTTVRELLDEDAVRDELLALYRDEIVPGFATHGLGSQARDYAAQTIERFRNPFLRHRLADIAQNHAAKIERRAGAFLDWTADRDGAGEAQNLRALVASAGREGVRR